MTETNTLDREDLFNNLYSTSILTIEDEYIKCGLIRDLNVIINKIGDCPVYQNTLYDAGYKHAILDVIKYLEKL